MMVPVLTTARLTLRGDRCQDIDDVAALWAAPAVLEFTSRKPATREEAWQRLLRHAGHWALLGYGFWVIEETATGQFIGQIGLMQAMRDITPDLFGGAPECGWVLSPAAHGKGFAGEALQAMLHWADTVLNVPALVCMIDSANMPSLKLAGRCGFCAVGTVAYKDGMPVVLRRTRAAL